MASASSLPVIASGGVGSVTDLLALLSLAPLGVEGVIVGRALYDGSVDLGEALQAVGSARLQDPLDASHCDRMNLRAVEASCSILPLNIRNTSDHAVVSVSVALTTTAVPVSSGATPSPGGRPAQAGGETRIRIRPRRPAHLGGPGVPALP